MNIFEAVSIRIPCPVCRQHYEVPLSDILLSDRMLKEGCPVPDETECPPLFQTRLIGSEILRDLAMAWNRLENNVRRNNGELVISDTPQRLPHRPQSPMGSAFPKQQGQAKAKRGARQLQCECRLTGRRSRADLAARDRGLDQTLGQTFPCSDALSCTPDPPLDEAVWR